ncbi:adhesin [Aggregatibacter actinomycetemcomitans serotype d str. SA3033]|uniref:Adhesin n=2 Tax=Aggregatibacter actinomycetemcomitans TaxID=714 RepID=A0FEX1_AGGAC|nr:trimeric autotransporter adhesin EmaA [Aggregatibacter actinomycetemcomitans]ABJ97454.1 extracellular matrix protein adhesin A [Aggregatibacter actinomycetemcomitans]ABJ97455.1 extracellular matrix protein adhesin A [Aggregatibacter actinomycetemcomitans]ABJ97463.1 extracellular matrix protein adhesin A [Aggregatibacter actinomycetemcomitans]AMQ94581.1 adhesin [Aggregatibacter actinomycetemcomitans]EKX98379.1 Hep/Hag repeat protein [Aggregatibacter actinomycetemcomitans Y4]
MNKVFKVIWCKTSQTWVAVSELSKAFSLSTTTDIPKKTKIFIAAAPLLFLSFNTNAYIAIGSVENNSVKSEGANSSPRTGSRTGNSPFNYFNPGSKSYENKDQLGTPNRLYDSRYAYGIAIGKNSDARDADQDSNGIALGDYAKATGGLAMALGSFSRAEKNGGIAIGTASRSSGINSLAMMRQSAATGDYSTAIGSVAWAAGESSFALGASATAKGDQSIAIGSVKPKVLSTSTGNTKKTKYDGLDNTQTNGHRSMALGTAAKTNGDDSFALGYGSQTGGFDIVHDSYLNENVTSANTSQKAEKAIAVGTNAKALKQSSVAFGYEANAGGENTIAIGSKANATYKNVVAIGESSSATKEGAMAIGQGAQANVANSLALGTGTIVTSIDGGTSKYISQNYDINNGVVAVANAGKERRIINVAGGRNDTDAVNVAQLKFVNDNLAKSIAGAGYNGYEADGHTYKAPVFSIKNTNYHDAKTAVEAAQTNYVSVNSTNTAADSNYDNKGAKAVGSIALGEKAVQSAAKEAVKVTGSAPINVNKTDVNGVDTYAVTFNGPEAAKSVPLTYKANGSGDKTVMLDKGLNFTNGTMTTASVANDGVVKYDVNLSTIKVEDGKAAVAGTPGTNGANGTDGKDGVATVKNVVEALNNAAWTITASKSDGEVVGNASNSVKNGDTVTYDAGKNIKITQSDKKFSFATKDNVEFTSVVTGNTKLTDSGVEITNGPKLTQSGVDAGGKKITNVADGVIAANSKDAVNGGQLFAETAKAKTTVEKGDDNIQITSETATDGHINYKVALNPSLTVGPRTNGHPITIDGNNGYITGLTNTSWTGAPTTGRAATEDQLSIVDKKFDNKVSLGGDNGRTTEKSLSHNGGIKFNIKGGDSQKYVTTSGSGDDVTVDLAQTTKNKIDNAADKDLANITDNGKKVITALGAVVKAADSTITVTDETDNTTGQKTYKIKANIPTPEKTAMASGNNTTIEGDGSTANPFKVNLKDDLALGQKDANGVTGKDSSIKVNGKDGSIALNGKDGANPVTLNTAQGPAGVNGTNPKDRLMVNNEAVATLEDGLKFAGDNGTEIIHKTLNQKLEIVGGADKNKLSDNNIGVNANNGKLEVKLAKELNGLTSAQFKNGDNTTVIHGNGMTITLKDPAKSVSLTDKGLNNGGNQIVNIDSGLKQADGSTVALKDASGDTLKNAANIGDLQKSINDITNAGKNGGFGLSDDNGATAKANLGETVKVKGDGSVITKVVTDNGKPTLQVGLSNHITVGDNTQAGTISVKGENGKAGVSINGKEASVTFAKDGQPGMSIAATRSADGKDALTLKGKDGKDGISFQEDGRITQVADGVNDKDAVNKSQLDRSIAQAKSGVSAGKNITVTPQKNADGSTTYTVETQNDVEFTTVKTGDTTLDSNGVNINGGPSVTKDGIHANDKKITGVKDGEISAHSKEAVNGSQLHQTNQNVTNLANNVDKGLNFQGDNQEVTVNRKLGDQLNIRGGADPKKLTQNNIGVTADKNGTMTVQLAKEVNLGADGSLTVGNTTVNNDGVAIKDGPSMTSHGINAGGKRITNVAKGKAPTDAVNMSQLQDVGSAINNRIDNIDKRVKQMDKRRKAGTASALATAGLMQPHRDGQSALVAAVGQYQSETAVAVGYSRISDNGKYGVKVSFSTNSQGEVGGTAGAGYFW